MPSRRAPPIMCVTRYATHNRGATTDYQLQLLKRFAGAMTLYSSRVFLRMARPSRSPPAARDSMTSGTGDDCTNDRLAVRGKWRTKPLVLTMSLRETAEESGYDYSHRGQRQGRGPEPAASIDPDTLVPSLCTA